MLKLDLALETIQPDTPLTLALDVLDIKAANSGDWIRTSIRCGRVERFI